MGVPLPPGRLGQAVVASGDAALLARQGEAGLERLRLSLTPREGPRQAGRWGIKPPAAQQK